MAILYIMSGLASSGKSTFINYIDYDAYVSRDDIRFSMLKDGEPYFSHEKRVLHEFYKKIHEDITAGYSTVADATHLTSKRVNDTIRCLPPDLRERTEIIVVRMETPLNECLRRNENRTGRRHVPPQVIKDMDKRMEDVYTIRRNCPDVDTIWRIYE